MLDEMSPEHFDEWQAYDRIEPIGNLWLQAGTIASSAHNAGMLTASAMGARLNDDAFKAPDDFIPKYQEPEPKYIDAMTMEHTLRMMFPGK